MSTATPASGMRRRQAWTVALLFSGYAAYSFCRSDLSVAIPLLIEALQCHGVTSHHAILRMGPARLLGSSCLRNRKIDSDRIGRPLGWTAQLYPRPGRRNRLYAALRIHRLPAHLLDRLDRQPHGTIDRLGRGAQGLLQVARLLLLWPK